MEIQKQHIILNLINSGRYEADLETGKIYSNIGLEKREMSGFINVQGYLQYTLDLGFGSQIMVYGQGFIYLAKWRQTFNPKFVIDHLNKIKSDNRADNLRCVTEAVNLNYEANRKERTATLVRVRLPIDVKEAIRAEAANGVSYVKLAKKYNTTRQTVSSIVNVK